MKTVRIDALADSPFRNLDRDAVVCVDVISSTTTLVTVAVMGRRAHPVGSIREAYAVAEASENALLAADEGRSVPEGFEVLASPADLAERDDIGRPMVLYAPPGTQLLANSAAAPAVYLACLRNLTATVQILAARHCRVALLTAGDFGRTRCEDDLAAARIARGLQGHGFVLEDPATEELVNRWSEVDLSLLGWGKSADELRRANRDRDLSFILSHVDDLDCVCLYTSWEIRALPALAAEQVEPARGGEAPHPETEMPVPLGRGFAGPKAVM
jgi:phosphosulfolactate phosphohydrolase-like enzyme